MASQCADGGGETPIEVDDVLAHYGVPGMKWGKRKSGRLTSTPKAARGSQDHKNVQKIRKKPVSELSNEELRRITARIDLEQKYKKANPSKVTKGRNAVKSIMATATAAASVYALVNGPAGKAAIKAVKSALEQAKVA